MLANIPFLQISVKSYDILTGHISSVTDVQMTDAYVHLLFDDQMRLLYVKPEKDGKKNEAIQLIGAVGNRLFHCAFHIQNGTIQMDAPGRDFRMTGVDLKVKADTKQYMDIDLLTGLFTGTVWAQQLVLKGRVDFTEEEPQYRMTLVVTGCDPASLDSGIEISDLASVYGTIRGDLRRPVVEGTLEMKTLTMPALLFENVKGRFHYEEGILTASQVTADVFSGRVEGEGQFHLDTKAYESHLQGQGLQGGIAARDFRLLCDVDWDLHIASAGRGAPQEVRGSFLSGSGRYQMPPFSKISGSFDRSGGTLRFRDVVISLAMGDVTTDALSIRHGRVAIGPVCLREALSGETSRIH